VCGSIVGGVAGVGVGLLLVVLPAWVCGFDGGAASVGVVRFVFRWVWWLICGAGVGVVEIVGKKKKKKIIIVFIIF
jgi:hypothetical protein